MVPESKNTDVLLLHKHTFVAITSHIRCEFAVTAKGVDLIDAQATIVARVNQAELGCVYR